MKLFSQAVLCAWATLVAALAFAQDGPASQYEKVQGLEPFIGFWQGDFQPPTGAEGTVTGFGRWTSNRSYAQFNWTFTPNDGERTHIFTILMGWNGKTQKLTSWVFGPDGQTTGEVTLQENGLTIVSKGTSANGMELASKAVYKLVDGKLTIAVSDVKMGDQDLPGYSFTCEKRDFPRRGGR